MKMKYNDKGEEVLDDAPIEAPIKFRRPPSIQELIAMHVRAQIQVERKMGKEDDDDFSEEDELDDILTPHELHAYAGDADMEMRKAEDSKKIVDKYIKRKQNKDAVNKDRIKDENGSSKEAARVGGDVSVGKTDSGFKGAGSKVAGGSEEADC